MVIGNGQLAKIFQNSNFTKDVCIFASGVSNSNSTMQSQFEREEKLLLEVLSANKKNKFVYFSSCALSAEDYAKNEYYQHKQNMEIIVKEYSDNYYIFRVPQLFGDLMLHKTLINFIYKSIEHQHKFNVYNEAYRYVIEINDVKKIVEAYLKYSTNCTTVDIANPHRYKVQDIVHTFEKLLDKKAKYQIIEKVDKYILDLSDMNNFIKKNNINHSFGKNYLINKLQDKLK